MSRAEASSPGVRSLDGVRAAIALAGAGLLILLVGLAAGGPNREADLVDGDRLGPRLVLAAVGLTVVAGLTLFALASRRPWVRGAAIVAGLLLALLLVALVEEPIDPAPPLRPVAQQVAPDAPEPTLVDEVESGEASGPSEAWGDAFSGLGRFLLFAAFAALALGGLYALGMWVAGLLAGGPAPPVEPDTRGSGPRPVDQEAIRTELAAELDRALRDLPLDGDPRQVVVAAYVRMNAVLEDHGVTRAPSDTPLEYLARALSELGGGRPEIEALTDLMQVAVFSQRPVGPEMADRAVADLGALRDALGAGVGA